MASELPTSARRIRALAAAIALVLGLPACTSTPTTPAASQYEALAAAAKTFDLSQIGALRDAFTAQPDFIDRITRLTELEEQAFQQMEQPLRLGAIGNALLAAYPGSLMGHATLFRYYERVNDPAAAQHREAADAIANAIASSAPGTLAAPRQVLSGGEARAWLWYRGERILGTVYMVPDEQSLRLAAQVAAATPDKPIETRLFDLTATYGRLAERVSARTEGPVKSQQLVRYFAERGDTAAITWIGIGLATQGGAQLRPGIAWLERAAATGNLYARTALARAYFNLRQYETSEPAQQAAVDTAVAQWRQAIGLGSEDAMMDLAGIYLNNLYGENGLQEGLRLLDQAAALGNERALLALAAMHRDGGPLPRDPARALALTAQAANGGSRDAKLTYVQQQLSGEPPALDDQGKAWLAELVEAEVPFAMYIEATLRADGKVYERDARGARRLLIRTADLTDNAELLNNIAWTLAVAEDRQLRDARKAVAIMDSVMADDAAATNPAYMDTWAAAHASNGDFDRAIDVQQQAVAAAREQQRNDVLNVLEQHLESFERREPIREPLP